MLAKVVGMVRTNLGLIIGKPIHGQGEFSKRIQHRNKVFWEAPEGKKLKHDIVDANISLENIKDVEHWQRKLSNKYNSREFAKKLGCRVPELYWKGRDLRTINFDQLPKQFVIRPTIGHSCSLVFLMNDSYNLMDKRTYTNEELLELMDGALNKNPNFEFLIEEFIRNEEGEYQIPKDYKFYTFNGQIARIEVINRYGPNDGSTSLYTEDWEQVDNLSSKYTRAACETPPKCLQELISQAKLISKAYEIFARIDFYATDKGAVFGEFTPTPGLGKVFTPKAEKMLIEYWNTYCKNKI